MTRLFPCLLALCLVSACSDDPKGPRVVQNSAPDAAGPDDEAADADGTPADGADEAEEPVLDPLRTPEMLLSARRAAIAFSTQSAEARKQTAQKALTVLSELYVNRAHKLETYGPEADVLAPLEALVASAESMTNAAFQTELHRIFVSQRDNALTYVFEPPMGCFTSRLPVLFRDVTDAASGQKVVAVAEVDPSWLPDDAARAVQVGDVLLRYGSESVADALGRLGSEARGATDAARRKYGISMLGFRPHFVTLLPETDELTLRFQRADGSEYTLDVPWISELEFLCLDPTRPNGERKQVRVHGFRDATAPLPGDVIEHPDGTMLEARELTTAQGKFGWITLHSFESVLDLDAALFNLGGVLAQLDDTDALLIDVRGNHGGTVELAEAATKFFLAGPMAIGGARFLNTFLNERVVRAMFPGTVFETALDAAILAGAVMSEPVPMLNADFVNENFVHSYTKPVLVLTDAFCDGACEIFAAAMQDNGVATIVGMDASTGGDAALGLSTVYVAELLGTDLPFDDARPILLFAHRQFVRGGSHAGQLLEDRGVTSEREVTYTLQDLRAGVDLEVALRERLLRDLASLAGD